MNVKVEHVLPPSASEWAMAIMGMRNPLNSWDKADSTLWYRYYSDNWDFSIQEAFKEDALQQNYLTSIDFGQKDFALMKSLINAGDDHGKYLRQLNIIADITAPTFWWLQFDTYKVGVTSNSCSKMHRLTEKEFERSDFYISDEMDLTETLSDETYQVFLDEVIVQLNHLRKAYLETKEKWYWHKILELLPESYMQKRTVSISLQALRHMVHGRWNHKLPIWRTVLSELVDSLPKGKELMGVPETGLSE